MTEWWPPILILCGLVAGYVEPIPCPDHTPRYGLHLESGEFEMATHPLYDKGLKRYPGLVDAAKRASDILNEIILGTTFDNIASKFVAIRLRDGSSDRILYDSFRDCVRGQSDEFTNAYIALRNLRHGTRPEEMVRILQYHRDAYDKGFRLPDPDSRTGGQQLIMDTAQHDAYRRQFAAVEMLLREERARRGY